MAGRFARVKTRHRTRRFVPGLLADLPRKNCWTIAEHAGDRDPHGMQHLLARAVWDTDGDAVAGERSTRLDLAHVGPAEQQLGSSWARC